MTTKIALFHGREVRKTLHENNWWFVVEDVVAVLTDSADSKQYIRKIRERDPELEKGWVQFVRTLDVETKGGLQRMNCADTEGIFRLIQSIPSLKAEPFKRWLAKVGYERVQEIEGVPHRSAHFTPRYLVVLPFPIRMIFAISSSPPSPSVCHRVSLWRSSVAVRSHVAQR